MRNFDQSYQIHQWHKTEIKGKQETRDAYFFCLFPYPLSFSLTFGIRRREDKFSGKKSIAHYLTLYITYC